MLVALGGINDRGIYVHPNGGSGDSLCCWKNSRQGFFLVRASNGVGRPVPSSGGLVAVVAAPIYRSSVSVTTAVAGAWDGRSRELARERSFERLGEGVQSR